MSASDHHRDWQAELGQPGQRKGKRLPDSSSDCHRGQDLGQAATTPLKTTAPCDSSPSLGLRRCLEIGKEIGNEGRMRVREKEFADKRRKRLAGQDRNIVSKRRCKRPTKSDEDDRLIWMLMLILRQSDLPSGPEYKDHINVNVSSINAEPPAH